MCLFEVLIIACISYMGGVLNTSGLGDATTTAPTLIIGSVVTVYVHRQVLVLVIEDVVVQDIVIASFFFKEITVQMRMLVIRIDPDEVAFPFVFKY